MSSSEQLQLVEALFRRGRYSEALRAATGTPHLGKRNSDLFDCLICECSQYGGAYGVALKQAESALASENASPGLKARYLGVIGRIRLDQHRREEAVYAFEEAVRTADRTEDLVTLAFLQQHWLVSARLPPGSALTSHVRNAYRTAVRSGDATALAGFHVRLSQVEGQQGAFARALHHAELADSLLNRSEHVAMLASLYVNKACIYGLTGSLEIARKSAEAGALYADQAGHARLSMAASACVAHIAIATGDLSVAESWLRRGMAIMERLQIVEGSLLDNAACIDLVRGDLRRAEAKLTHVRQPATVPKWKTGAEIYTLLSELHLRQRQGDYDAAASVIEDLKAINAAQRDVHLEARTTMAEIENVFDLGRPLDAELKLREALLHFPDGLTYWAEANRLSARSLWRAGRHEAARRQLARSSSAADVRGTRLEWTQALREYKSAGDSQPVDLSYGIPTQLEHANKFRVLMEDPQPTWFERNPVDGRSERDSLDGFDDAVSILELSEDSELRAREALATVLSLELAQEVALIARAPDGVRVISAHGWTHTQAAKVAHSGKARRLEVGSKGALFFELILSPTLDVRALFALNGIRKLLDAARSLETQKKDQQRLGALWQPEMIVEEPDAVFSSPVTIELMQTARKVAATSLPVLLTGDTGTGKEVIARAIHRVSPRGTRTFLPFNCSTVPRDMVESQLFGHKRGAFTGADHDFVGIIRSAEGGTLFLDEVGELSLEVQPKLLRFLETNEVHPLGEGKPIKVDVRIIAATNADLDDLVQKKEFREDLYYRLNIVRLQMPHLSERREEIPALATHLLRRFEMDEKKHSIKISDELMEYLLLYKWPGNVRQLSNELRKMVAMTASGETLTPEHLSPAIRATRRTVAVDPEPVEAAAQAAEPEKTEEPAAETTVPIEVPALNLKLDQPLPDAVEALERALIEHALAKAGGHIEEAARLLGISRKGLFLKRRRWLSGGEPPADAS